MDIKNTESDLEAVSQLILYPLEPELAPESDESDPEPEPEPEPELELGLELELELELDLEWDRSCSLEATPRPWSCLLEPSLWSRRSRRWPRLFLCLDGRQYYELLEL